MLSTKQVPHCKPSSSGTNSWRREKVEEKNKWMLPNKSL